jgi:hypothetical protein
MAVAVGEVGAAVPKWWRSFVVALAAGPAMVAAVVAITHTVRMGAGGCPRDVRRLPAVTNGQRVGRGLQC